MEQELIKNAKRAFEIEEGGQAFDYLEGIEAVIRATLTACEQALLKKAREVQARNASENGGWGGLLLSDALQAVRALDAPKLEGEK